MDLPADEFRRALDKKIKARKEDNLFRKRQTIDFRQAAEVKTKGRSLINFCSNDYLGLSNHPEIVSAFKAGADKFGIGSSASSMVSGQYSLHQRLEEKIAEKTGREAALIFSSGYMANLAVVTSFAGRSDAVFFDRLAHASLVDAARLSTAKLHRYQHGDSAALNLALNKATAKTKLVLTDTVFSMDGDIAPVRKIAEVCKQNHAVLVVDDAHGFGVLGKTGGGLLEEENIQPDLAPVLVATFGKALGTAGAFVAADKLMIETLVQFGRSYIYTTAQPPALASATLAALEVLEKEPWRRQKLHELVKRFKLGAEALGLDLLPSNTAIQPLVIGSSENALRISENLLEAGFLISAIRPPTVPEGTARLRITITAAHTEDQIDRLLESLGRVL